MPNLTGIQEKLIRSDIKTYLDTLGVCGNVFDRRRLITSRKDFARALSVPTLNEKYEIQFCEIEFLRFEDSDTIGFHDCPGITLYYNLHLFKQFVDLREGGGNSDDDFTAAILKIRDAFLNKRKFWEAITNPITAPDFAQFGNDSLTDCTGHYIDLQFNVDWNKAS